MRGGFQLLVPASVGILSVLIEGGFCVENMQIVSG